MTDSSTRPITKLRGAARIVRLFGIDVHVHWSWLLVAVIQVQLRGEAYASFGWTIVEYLGLFLIVLLHEFGHALACRSVGGQAEDIMLWPLGGVAYVQPPQRPGAVLWSLAAGPLVNVVLIPVTLGLALLGNALVPDSDASQFLFAMAAINAIVLVFNILPIYPLDGGQMLRALLWYFIGPHRSLKIATGIGLVGAGLGALFAFRIGDLWLALIAAFAAMQSWKGFRVARARSALAALPRQGHTSCPTCREPPPVGAYWPCRGCAQPFDPFGPTAACSRCGTAVTEAPCPFCGAAIPTRARGGAILDVEADVV